MNTEDMVVALGMIASAKVLQDTPHIGVYAQNLPTANSKAIVKRLMPNDAKTVAHELFAVLHDFDAKGVKLLWIENLPDSEEWEGVRDRLERAAAASN